MFPNQRHLSSCGPPGRAGEVHLRGEYARRIALVVESHSHNYFVSFVVNYILGLSRAAMQFRTKRGARRERDSQPEEPKPASESLEVNLCNAIAGRRS